MKSAREAKEFLVSQIAEEADRESVVLSETERKMLYFSESGWTLPDMAAVSDEFDSESDQNKYEKKIARIIRGAYKSACKRDRETYDNWWASIRLLNREDHYLSVMTRRAGLRPRHDQLKLFITSLAVATAFLFSLLIAVKYNLHLPGAGKRLAPNISLAEYVWAGLVCVFIVYQLLRFVLGARRADDLTSKLLRQCARLSNRMR
jgi:hypothetical protein